MKFLFCVLWMWLFLIVAAFGQTEGIQSTASILIVDTYADLVDIDKSPNLLVQTRGYSTATDGLGGLYRYDAGTDTYKVVGQQGSTASLSELTAAAIDVDSEIVFGATDEGDSTSYKLSLAELKKTGVQVVNVKQHGAVGDGVADDTTAIQAAIDAIDSSGESVDGGGVIYFPPGRYLVSTTIDLHNIRGLILQGAGSHDFDSSPSAGYPQSYSAIVWNGTAGGTVMTGGIAEFKFENFAIWGKPPGGATQAGVGFHLVATAGVGAGHGRIDNVRIADCDVGWKNGTAAGDSNCADMHFGRIAFADCTDAYQVINTQSVNHVFDVIYCRNIGTVFDIQGGGVFRVNFLHSIETDEVLNISAPSTYTGETNAQFNFGTLKFDTQTTTPKIVIVSDTTAGGDRKIKFDSIRLPNASIKSDGIFLFSLAGSCYLHVEDITYIDETDDVLNLDGTGTRKPVALFERATIRSTSLPAGWTNSAAFVTTSGSGTVWGFKDCRTLYNQGKLPDIGNHSALDVRVGYTGTATASDATPDVSGFGILKTANAAPTTITALDNGIDGQVVTVLINDANTTVDFTGTTLKGNNGVDWTPASGDHMTCTKIGSNWYCDISEN